MAEPEWSQEQSRALVERLLATYTDGRCINNREGHDLPRREVVFSVLDRLMTILFPGFLEAHPVTNANIEYHIGDQINHVYIDLVDEVERALRYECKLNKCDACTVRQESKKAVAQLLGSLPNIRETLKEDIDKAFEGDPAARSPDAIVLSYPYIEAITTHRLAHELYNAGVPLVPRLWSERAHARTGIDINPGATIGSRFFIDHGTGVVIGETCHIGRNVAIYQGVTLGALAPAKGQKLRGKQRHPTLEDDVIIYAGATILGGDTVIGQGAVIGGNVWLTDSVPPGTKVLMAKADLVYLQPGGRKSRKAPPHPGEFRCPAKPLCEADGTIPVRETSAAAGEA